jgi:hypothetical protein
MLTASLSLLAPSAAADSRAQNPVQIQFDGGGLTLGYHFGERLYLGATHQPKTESSISYGMNRQNGSEHEIYGQDHVKEDRRETLPRTSLEGRLSPWPFGAYLALGALSTGANHQTVTYNNVPRVVGKSAYSTSSIKVDVRGQAQTAAAAGAGYNHVFRWGMSLSAGFLVALRQSDKPDVEVTDSTGSVSQADLDRLKKRAEDDNRGPHGMLHLAVGWNF